MTLQIYSNTKVSCPHAANDVLGEKEKEKIRNKCITLTENQKKLRDNTKINKGN